VAEFLESFPSGTSLLDIPVGTGRFLELYAERGFKTTGIDVSSSMLEIAKQKAAAISSDANLSPGDILALAYPERAFDVAVCIRLMQWMGKNDFRAALSELVRVTRRAIIISVPSYTPWSQVGLPGVSRLARLLAQVRLRLYKRRKRGPSVIHERADILAAFSTLGLSIVAKKRINQSAKSRRQGYEKDIYLLEVSQTGQSAA
jgi:ubiquinone/menaquinone biosynthesis C-methylase UbiE